MPNIVNLESPKTTQNEVCTFLKSFRFYAPQNGDVKLLMLFGWCHKRHLLDA